jgi:hypothetical protein
LPRPHVGSGSSSTSRMALTKRCWCAQEEHVHDHFGACSERTCDKEPCKLACEQTNCDFKVTCCARGNNDTSCCYVPTNLTMGGYVR